MTWVRSWLLGLALAGGSPSAPPPLAIANVTLIDGTGAAARPGMTVVVQGDRIIAIGPTATTHPVGAQIVDGTGKYLIPGLWDMHSHLGGFKEVAFPLLVANGVTGVRDMGNSKADEIIALRDRVASGALVGPRIFLAGPTLDASLMVRMAVGGPFEGYRVAIDDPATARRVADSLKRLGVDYYKVHSATPRAAYFALLEAAKRNGLFVVGHVPDSVSAEAAIRAGQRTIEHNWGIFRANSSRGAELQASMLEAMRAPAESVRVSSDPRRFFVPYALARLNTELAATESYDPERARRFATLAAAAPVWFCPTLVTLRSAARRNEPAVLNPPELRYVPRRIQATFDGLPPAAKPTVADVLKGKKDIQIWLGQFRALVRARAKFLAGTDFGFMGVVPGWSLHDELALLVEIGLTPLQAIQAASRNAAESLNLLDKMGTVEVGKAADLVLLDADPLAAIGNTRRIRAVVARGRLLDRIALDGMLAEAERSANAAR